MINTLAILTGNALSIVIVVILLLNLPYEFSKGSIPARIFTGFSIPIILGALFGIGSAFFDGVPGVFARAMVILCGSAGIIFPVIASFSFWLYVESTTKGSLSSVRRRIAIALIPIVIIFILVIVNLWVPLTFSVSPDNIYERGPLGLISYIVGPAYLVVTIFRIAYLKSQKHGFLFVSMAGISVPIIVVGIIQVTSYGIIQSWLGLAIGMFSLYMGMQKDLLFTDPMTRAFNRIYLDHIITEAKSKNLPLGGIMIDIDHFKSINDTLGHLVGDNVIKRATLILKTAASKDTNVIRVGGDEFLIITHTDNEADLVTLMDRIRETCNQINASHPAPATIEFSMGASVYIPEKDAESAWLTQMDERMYEEKATHRVERRKDRRTGDDSSL